MRFLFEEVVLFKCLGMKEMDFEHMCVPGTFQHVY
jgi:hypothetical protein